MGRRGPGSRPCTVVRHGQPGRNAHHRPSPGSKPGGSGPGMRLPRPQATRNSASGVRTGWSPQARAQRSHSGSSKSAGTRCTSQAPAAARAQQSRAARGPGPAAGRPGWRSSSGSSEAGIHATAGGPADARAVATVLAGVRSRAAGRCSFHWNNVGRSGQAASQSCPIWRFAGRGSDPPPAEAPRGPAARRVGARPARPSPCRVVRGAVRGAAVRSGRRRGVPSGRGPEGASGLPRP